MSNINNLDFIETDIQKIFFEQGKNLASTKELSTSLEDCLMDVNKDRLLDLGAAYDVTGRHKLKKAELVDILKHKIVSEEELLKTLTVYNSNDLNLHSELVKGKPVDCTKISPLKYALFLEKGIGFTYFKKDNIQIIMPKEVIEASKKVPKKVLNERRERFNLVFDYLSATINLYGVFHVLDFIDLFNTFNEEELTLDEFNEIYTLIRTNDNNVARSEELLAHKNFSHDPEELVDFLEEVEDKPFFDVTKEDILKYVRDEAGPIEEGHLPLKEYIYDKLKDEEETEELIKVLIIECRQHKFEMSDICDILAEYGVDFKNKKDADNFFKLFMEFNNNTKQWINRGYSPKELSEINKAKLTPKPLVGRNEPCPCGSGKKYKKCCL